MFDDMRSCVQVVQTLQGLRSRNEKVALLKDALKDETFRKFVKYAVDPYITFGVTTYEMVPDSAYGTDIDFFEFLDRLVNRQIVGDNAREALGRYALLDESIEEVIKRILAKDLRCGVGVKMVNAAMPGFIREFLIPRSEVYEPGHLKHAWLGSPKFDGFRALAICTSRRHVAILSSNGRELPGADHLKPLVASYYRKIKQPFVFDSELVSSSLYQTSSYARRKNGEENDLVLKIFDYVPYEIFAVQGPTGQLEERLALLADVLPPDGQDTPIALTEHVPLFTEDEIDRQMLHYLKLNYEGLMLKDPKASYFYKRSRSWQKLKPSHTEDLPVLQVLEGQGQFKGTTGSLLCDYHGKPVRVFGFTQKERDEFWCCMPEVVEVEFQEVTPGGSIRHGRFVRVRDDKA